MHTCAQVRHRAHDRRRGSGTARTVARDLRARAARCEPRRMARLWLCRSGVPEAREGGWRVPVRLVKGAYWDSEIKRAQVQGLDGYPVFTRKAHTDVSYLACARRILQAHAALYPMFATHNAHTASAVVEYAAENGVA